MSYVAGDYDKLFEQFQRSNRLLAELVQKSVPFRPQIVVDGCCGTGIFLQNLWNEFSETPIVGIDIQQDLVDAAKAKSAHHHHTSFVVGDFAAEYKKLGPLADQLVVLKACYHFVSDRITVSDILRNRHGRVAVCVIERSVYSAEAYPVFPRAKAALSGLTQVARQNEIVLGTSGYEELAIFSAGEVGQVPTDAWCNALLSRQLSYLHNFETHEIKAWTDHLRANHPITVPVFEEYRGYCFVA